MSLTNIEWTDRNWPWARGCTRVSPGCENCYAERIAARFSDPGMWGHGFASRTKAGPRWTGRVEFKPHALLEPLRVRKPQRWFPSTFDPFHESLDFNDIAAVYGVMAAVPEHTFQILTKRPERRLQFHARLGVHPLFTITSAISRQRLDFPRQLQLSRVWPLPNVWEGVSVEDQATADARIPLLLQTPAAVRFVSYEPALAAVDFDRLTCRSCSTSFQSQPRPGMPQVCTRCGAQDGDDATQLHGRWLYPMYGAPRLDWIIVGGESGNGARPFDLEWARSTVLQCREAGVACFVKQLGARPVSSDPCDVVGHPLNLKYTGRGLEKRFHLTFQDSKGGDPAEWPADLRVREFPEARRT